MLLLSIRSIAARLFLTVACALAVSACNTDSEPHRLVADISGLEVPRDAVVLEYREKWNRFQGDGYAAVTLQLQEPEFVALAAQATRLGYHRFYSGGPRPEGLFERDTVPEGLYRVLRKRGQRTEATVLDTRRRRILVRLTLL
jgi:hypothetical protein